MAKWVIPPVALGTLAQYFYTNYVNLEIYNKKTPIIAVSSFIAAAVNYGLNYMLIPRYGYLAAAYTTLISYILLMLLHFLAVRLILKEHVYSDSYMFTALLICVILGLSMCLMYGDGIKNILMRYVVAFVVLGIFAIIRRNDIILLFDYLKKRFLKKGLNGNEDIR